VVESQRCADRQGGACGVLKKSCAEGSNCAMP